MVVVDESDGRHSGPLTRVGHSIISRTQQAFEYASRGESVTGREKQVRFTSRLVLPGHTLGDAGGRTCGSAKTSSIENRIRGPLVFGAPDR